MVTLEQAKEYLESQGITIPDFVLQALVDQANSIQECLDAYYPASTSLLIQLYLLALMGLGQGDKYISSQTGPNGASRSFRYRRGGCQLRIQHQYNSGGEVGLHACHAGTNYRGCIGWRSTAALLGHIQEHGKT
ncbi:hypothetical protein ACHOYD_10190 [Enterobacter hormaechei]|uniref:DUF7370 family protein n=1 Tax=Enterobacter cloacae complex sp. 302F9 TaxID=3395821 RepID=UPI00374C42D0